MLHLCSRLVGTLYYSHKINFCFRYARNQKYFPDFVFIDEAAQAMEPEATVAIALLKLGKQLVLAGDPKQLGPICASTIAERYNLGKLFLILFIL